MINLTIDHIISEDNIARNIFYHLSDDDLQKCALVNRTWYTAVKGARSRRKLKLTVELIDKLKSKNKDLFSYIRKNYKHATEVDIYGWSRGTHIQNEVYDTLFDPQFKAKKLILRGRGFWDSCRCPGGGNVGSLCGEQVDTIDEQRLTNLEFIHVGTTFCISSCALLDLISRSPRLKVLKFYGLIEKNDHYELFNRLRFHCDLERLYWPWPYKRHIPTMTTLIKRNENITTFNSNSDATCDLLAAEALPNLRYLSLTLNEKWLCKPGNLKKVHRHLQKIQYLSSAKNVEALEVRTFDLTIDEDSDDNETNVKVGRVYENYIISFWDQVSKMANLKYLAVYGAWEFERVCREMAKNSLQIEYLKINLMPTSAMSALDAQEDSPILSMVDGVRNLRKLPRLRSLHYICCEKLGSIDSQTVVAFKEIMDLFWIFDVKAGFTEEIEDLYNSIMRRGNQLGKSYKYYLHVQSKSETKFANILSEHSLKYPLGAILKDKMTELAEAEATKRQRKGGYENFHVWGLEMVGNYRDRETYDNLAAAWKNYNDQFFVDPAIV